MTKSDILKSIKIPEKKIIVLKKQISELEITQIMDKKKTSVFGSALRRPSPSEIHVDSLKTAYEPYLILSGEYEIDFFRKGSYKINVQEDVKELILGDGVFPIKTESGVWGKVRKKMKEGVGIRKKEVELEMEEHAYRKIQEEIVFNSHGKVQDDFPYKIDSRSIENFPTRILEESKDDVGSMEINDKDAISKLYQNLKDTIEGEIRINTEEFSIEKIEQVYVPIFEARLIDSRNKVNVLRVDGITKKVL